jgi:acetyl-CoA carboxylase biotin carboxyl carrier protein
MTEKNNLPVDKINQLSQILKEQGLTEIEVEVDDIKIRVRKEASIVAAPSVVASPVPVASERNSSTPSVDAGLHLVKSPMVGTFYASPSPDAAAFVKVGDRVTKGQTLCIVEAMKLMNELPSDIDGEVVEICVQDASAISFGQVIIKIRH